VRVWAGILLGQGPIVERELGGLISAQVLGCGGALIEDPAAFDENSIVGLEDVFSGKLCTVSARNSPSSFHAMTA